MKKDLIILVVLITATIIVKAQIPNNGFEDWITESGIEIPLEPWVTNNLLEKPDGVTFNPVTKSTDHYPSSVGSYSIRMENNISFLSEAGETLPYWACSYGYVTTAFYPGFTGPVFSITGHPTSFCGYYKFLPQNNDTMVVSISLYNNGTVVSSATFSSATAASDWTSFSISLPTYTAADSAQIGFSAFYSELGLLPSGPHGNSVLFIDNLSFDNLITNVSEKSFNKSVFNFYPNPAVDIVMLDINHSNDGDRTLNIYNITGKLISSETLKPNQVQISMGDLFNGIYFIELKSKDWSEKQKLIIQR